MSSTSCRSQCGSESPRSSSLFTEDLPHQYPFYPHVEHPLIYYAQVPESCGFKQRIRAKKDNPNCFVRAFRWYTQEHNVQKSRANEREPDTAGFASWLDHKYDQFLNDSCQNSVTVSRQLTSSIQIVPNKPCKLRTDKYKKPWGRLGATSRRNGGDCHPGKRNQSFEIILQPKDLSHPASECCFQNRQDTCCETRATGISSDTEVMSRNSKLQNYSTVVEGKGRVLPVPHNSKIRRFQGEESVILTRTLNSASSLNDKKHVNVSCQCPGEYAGTAAASTQYDLNDLESVPLTWEQPVKTEQATTPEFHSFPTTVCECRDRVVKNDVSTQCFQEESTKMLVLNNDEGTKTTIDHRSSLLHNPEVKSSEAVISQRRKYVCECLDMEMYSSSQYCQSKLKITDCNRRKASIKDHDTESKAGLQEEKINSNEVMNTLQIQSPRKASVMDESLKLATCKIQPELKSAECEACKLCPLNRNAETITAHSEDKVTMPTSSEQAKVTSKQQISIQPETVKIHSSTQLTISESKTSDFDVCHPCRVNSKITDTKVAYIQNNVIESSMCQQARAKSNEKMDTQRPSLKTSVICACPKDNNFGIIQQSQPEFKISECKVCKLNKNKQKTFCDQEKVTSNQQISIQPANVKIHSSTQLTISESKTSDFDVCHPCRVNSKITDTKVAYIQNNVIESSMCQQARAKSNEKMNTQRPSLKTSVICACSKDNNVGIIQQSQLESKISEFKVCKLNKNKEKTLRDHAKVKSTEKLDTEKPQSNSKTSMVCPAIKVTSESRHSQPESKCDVCKTCKVIETKTYSLEKTKSNEKMDTQRPSLKTSTICACPKDNNFSIIQQSQRESKISDCKVCKLNKNKEKTFCDQGKIIKEWKPVENSVDIMCKCPKPNKEVNQSRKASKTLPTRQATAQTSDYSICLRPPSSALPDESVRRLSEAMPSISTSPAIAIAAEVYMGKGLPGGIPLLVQVMAKR